MSVAFALLLLVAVVGSLVVIASPGIGGAGRPRLRSSPDDAANVTPDDFAVAAAFLGASASDATPTSDRVDPAPPDAPSSVDAGGPSPNGDS